MTNITQQMGRFGFSKPAGASIGPPLLVQISQATTQSIVSSASVVLFGKENDAPTTISSTLRLRISPTTKEALLEGSSSVRSFLLAQAS